VTAQAGEWYVLNGPTVYHRPDGSFQAVPNILAATIVWENAAEDAGKLATPDRSTCRACLTWTNPQHLVSPLHCSRISYRRRPMIPEPEEHRPRHLIHRDDGKAAEFAEEAGEELAPDQRWFDDLTDHPAGDPEPQTWAAITAGVGGVYQLVPLA